MAGKNNKKEKIIKKETKPEKNKKALFTRKRGIWFIIIGIAMQFLNMLTYGLWGIDIDILGAVIFILGLIIMVVGWKK